MDFVFLGTIGAMAGTLSVILVYAYLYLIYRERYICLWSIAWSVLFLRIIFFDSGLFSWQQSLLGFAVYQLLFIGCSIIYVGGTYIFIGKKFDNRWLYGAAGASLLSVLVLLLQAPLPYKVIPPAFFGGVVLLWIGTVFYRCLDVTGAGKNMTAAAFILWSMLTFALPFIIQSYQVFVAITGGILRLIIAVGTLLVYFEKTRKDLIKKESQYRLFAENAVDVIFRYKLPEAKFEYISSSAYAVTGYSPEELYADPQVFFNSVHPDDAPLVNSYFTTVDYPADLPLTFRFLHKDKRTNWVEQKCVPIYNKEGQMSAVEGIMRDVTARKILEDDRMKMVGNMAATVAHEIRNPLTTVYGFLQYMERKGNYRDDNDKIKLMLAELARANSIIREYLSLSRRTIATFKTCSLNNIIESLFPLVQADALASKVQVSLGLDCIPELWLDENEMRQLLLNFIRNGIEAMPGGGDLSIRTFRKDGKVVLSISDQGAGIPSHVLEKLGTPFLTTKKNGTGLGLPLCYQIANRHNAVIDVSTSNRGTTFFVYFNPSRNA